jgi:hypothetical protein
MDHLLHELEEGIGKNTSIIGTGIHSTFSSIFAPSYQDITTFMPTQETTTSQNPSTSHGHGTSLAPHIITPTTTTGCFTPNPSTLAAGHGTSTSQNPFFHGTGTGQDDRESTPHQRAEPSTSGSFTPTTQKLAYEAPSSGHSSSDCFPVESRLMRE